MHVPELLINDGLLRQMNLDGEFPQSEHGCLVPAVVSVQSERQSLCAKPPEVFLEKETRHRAQAIPQCIQRFLVELGDCLPLETRQKSSVLKHLGC